MSGIEGQQMVESSAPLPVRPKRASPTPPPSSGAVPEIIDEWMYTFKDGDPPCVDADTWRDSPCDGQIYYVIVALGSDGSLRRSSITLCDTHLDARGLAL